MTNVVVWKHYSNQNLDNVAVACLIATSFLSLWALLAFSASSCSRRSRRGTSGILNTGPRPLGTTGVSEPSRRNGVPSISPHVMRGEASTPVTHTSLRLHQYALHWDYVSTHFTKTTSVRTSLRLRQYALHWDYISTHFTKTTSVRTSLRLHQYALHWDYTSTHFTETTSVRTSLRLRQYALH